MGRQAAKYYSEAGRDFPWRREADPFKLAIAEILLQKTRAASVLDTYQKLISEFPDAQRLSAADPDRLELLLRPLGLSRKRATHLISMSEVIQELGISVFEDWRQLVAQVPGIGAYAARAIASIGHRHRIGVVDANVSRIFRRMFRIQSRDSRAAIYQIYADAVAMVSPDPRASNLGLLDLGAAICGSKPRCDLCPLKAVCARFEVPDRH